MNNIKNKIKHFWIHLTGLIVFFFPVLLFLIMLCLFKIAWGLNFEIFLKIIEVLIWPITVLMILYFFKRVLTYLFFSLNEFNFFGIKGELKDVRDLISEKVNEKFENEKREVDRKKELDRLQKKIDSSFNKADKNLELAKEIFAEWKKTIADNKKLQEENDRLRDMSEKQSQVTGNTPLTMNDSEIGTGDKVDNSSPTTPNK